MSSRTIGKIVSIGVNGIVAEVYDSLGSYVNTVDGIRFVGEVGSYVSIYEIGRTVIAEIEAVAEKSSIVNGRKLSKANSNRQIFLNLIGEIIDGKFFFGVSKMPLIFAEVNIISEKGNGQLIFTSHNLRPLETIDKGFIAFTTTNPNNRYIRLTNVKVNNNLRDFYYRDIVLGEQSEPVYNPTNNYEIALAFREAGEAFGSQENK